MFRFTTFIILFLAFVLHLRFDNYFRYTLNILDTSFTHFVFKWNNKNIEPFPHIKIFYVIWHILDSDSYSYVYKHVKYYISFLFNENQVSDIFLINHICHFDTIFCFMKYTTFILIFEIEFMAHNISGFVYK